VKYTNIIPIILLLITQNTFAQNYTLVWSDSFTNNNINTNNWFFESGTGNSGWGNNELQYYTNRADNATIINGNLAIIAKKEMYQNSDYTSARMITKNLQQFQYGKIEARIKLPQTKGVWPAFWMLGSNIDAVSWPKCGEIDILEHVNTETLIHGTIHWDNGGHVQSGSSTNCNVSNYHIYGIEWTADSIKWMLDNSVYYKYSIKNNVNNTGAFHKPFFLLLNMAVGGNWPGSPNAGSVFPDTMIVDYVNVFQKFALRNSDLQKKSDIHFYPNPVHDMLYIDVAISTENNNLICIYNTLGMLVKKTMLEKNMTTQAISITDIPNGNYFATVHKNGNCIGKHIFLKE
jgi:beta-glucanase (GH16 family)